MHGKKLKREKGDIAKATQATSGIKSLSKEKREMLEVCFFSIRNCKLSKQPSY